jgi:hypothetical protein
MLSVGLKGDVLICNLISRDAFWGLIGVIIGLAGGEGVTWLRYRVRIRRLRKSLDSELRFIQAQVPQKRAILASMRKSLETGKVLSGLAIPTMDTAFRQRSAELYLHVTPKQHTCLHVIYESLRIIDQKMASFDTDYRDAVLQKFVTEPRTAFLARLGELDTRCGLVATLVKEYLAGAPRDVFYLEMPEAERETAEYV